MSVAEAEPSEHHYDPDPSLDAEEARRLGETWKSGPA